MPHPKLRRDEDVSRLPPESVGGMRQKYLDFSRLYKDRLENLLAFRGIQVSHFAVKSTS